MVQAADPVTGRVGVLVEGEEQPLSLKRTNLALPGDTPVREERVSVRLPPDEDSIMGAPLSRSEQALQHFRANHTPSIKLVFEDGKWSAKASRGIPAGEVLIRTNFIIEGLPKGGHSGTHTRSVPHNDMVRCSRTLEGVWKWGAIDGEVGKENTVGRVRVGSERRAG